MSKEFYIYHNYIPKVGGIETVVRNLANVLDRNGVKVTILYTSVESVDTLFGYARYANLVKITPDLDLKVDLLLLASNHSIPKGVEAERYLQWVHSDYDRYKLELKNMSLYKNGRLKYVAVSEHAKGIVKKNWGIDCEVIYNIVDPDFGKDKRRVLRLVTNSRLSKEKGFMRMLQFAKQLKDKGVRFNWVVYGDNSHYPEIDRQFRNLFKNIDEVHFVGFKNNVEIGLTNADYLVQLSDFEGCPLSVLEALKMEVPCLVTDWNGVDEIIKDGKNGYILPMVDKDTPDCDLDISKVDVDKIVDNIPKFKNKDLSTVKDWLKLIEE